MSSMGLLRIASARCSTSRCGASMLSPASNRTSPKPRASWPIDAAKRILMDSRGLPEPKAYAEMRSAAMSQGKRIADIAEAIVTAHKLIGG
jgi:hypothetical protein